MSRCILLFVEAKRHVVHLYIKEKYIEERENEVRMETFFKLRKNKTK